MSPPLPALVRQRRIRTLSDVLPALGVTITPDEDGHVNVRLPAEVAELFLLDLQGRAEEWKEAMRKARIQECQRAAELRALSDETRLQVEAQEDGWLADYERLRAEGKGHRESLGMILGLDEEAAPLLSRSAIAEGIRVSLSRRKAQARAAPNADICRLAEEGLTRQEIADQLRLQHQTVSLALKKAGVPVKAGRKGRSKVPAAWCAGEKGGA
jgi:hypothetical protein